MEDLFILALVIIGIFFLIQRLVHRGYERWFSPQAKGRIGETYIVATLNADLPEDYLILNNLYLPLPDGSTTQIDHVIVSRFGVFVIETKTYSGWIFADANSKYWTQILYQERNHFQNPLRQNYRHIYAIANLLKLHKSFFHNIVVFNNTCEFKVGIPDGVTYTSNLSNYITSFKDILFSDKQVKQIAEAIEAWQATVTDNAKESHVYHLYQRHEGVQITDAAPRCPYCGGEMTIRHRRDGTGSFYGCKSYPACRGIVKIR